MPRVIFDREKTCIVFIRSTFKCFDGLILQDGPAALFVEFYYSAIKNTCLYLSENQAEKALGSPVGFYSTRFYIIHTQWPFMYDTRISCTSGRSCDRF